MKILAQTAVNSVTQPAAVKENLKSCFWCRENCTCVDLGPRALQSTVIVCCHIFGWHNTKIRASDVRSLWCSAGIYCRLNEKLVFILALLGHIRHTVTDNKEGEGVPVYWLWSLCVCVCLCVWWNYTLRDNTSLVLITGLFNGEIASLLLDKGIICSAVFRLVLFLEALTHCLFSLHPCKYRLWVPICVLPYVSYRCTVCTSPLAVTQAVHWVECSVGVKEVISQSTNPMLLCLPGVCVSQSLSGL